MNEIIFNIEEDEFDGGYIAEAYISEKEQIITQGDTIEELKVMIKQALDCHFGGVKYIPSKINLHFITKEVLAVLYQKLLRHKNL